MHHAHQVMWGRKLASQITCVRMSSMCSGPRNNIRLKGGTSLNIVLRWQDARLHGWPKSCTSCAKSSCACASPAVRPCSAAHMCSWLVHNCLCHGIVLMFLHMTVVVMRCMHLWLVRHCHHHSYIMWVVRACICMLRYMVWLWVCTLHFLVAVCVIVCVCMLLVIVRLLWLVLCTSCVCIIVTLLQIGLLLPTVCPACYYVCCPCVFACSSVTVWPYAYPLSPPAPGTWPGWCGHCDVWVPDGIAVRRGSCPTAMWETTHHKLVHMEWAHMPCGDILRHGICGRWHNMHRWM